MRASLPVLTEWSLAIDSYTQWMRAGNRRDGTIRLRLHYIHGFAASLEVGPWQAEPQELIDWLAAPQWSGETQKSARVSVRSFYRWAVVTGKIERSPAEALLPVIVAKRAPVVPREDAIDVALSKASQRDRLMLLLGSRAGLRRAEIAGLPWSEITMRRLRVVDGKGGRQRIVPLSAQLSAELRDERERRLAGVVGSGWRYRVDPGSPWVFPSQKGGHMSPDTVGGIITRCLTDVTPHGLRRRFATRAYKGTLDIRAVQELLGHSSPETTARYVGVDQDELVAAVDAAA